MELDLIPRPLVIITMTWFEIKPEPNLSVKEERALSTLVDIKMTYELENQTNEIKEITLPRIDSVFTLKRKVDSKILLKKTKIEITTKYFSLPIRSKDSDKPHYRRS